RRDTTFAIGEQGQDQIALAVVDAFEQQRLRRTRCARGACRAAHAQTRSAGSARAESSCGMSSPRGLSTMLSASVNRMSSSTNAMATPKRRERAGLTTLAIGNGVTQATRRLAV